MANGYFVQLSDPHLRVGDAERDAGLAAAVAQIAALDPPPVAVVFTGDLADSGDPMEYEQAVEAFRPLASKLHLIPGNADDRAALRQAFGLEGAPTDPVRFVVQRGPFRIIGCDTTIPGRIEGTLDLAWLAERLDEDRSTPTILALHHHPVPVGVRGLDGVGIPHAKQLGLEELLQRSPQVVGVIAGHVHRGSASVLAGRPIITVPSVNQQLHLNLKDDAVTPADEEPPAFAIHLLTDGRLVTHFQPVVPATAT